MAVASGRLRAPAFAAPTSRFRGRGAQALGILAILVVGYILFKNEYSWPASLTWDELPRKLDDAQNWLLDQRTEGSNPFFAVLTASGRCATGSSRRSSTSSNGSPGSACWPRAR